MELEEIKSKAKEFIQNLVQNVPWNNMIEKEKI